MSDYTELQPGETFDLSTQVIGLDRTTGKAVLMAPTKGPPRRLDGYTVGAPMLTGDAPHDGEMHPDADEVLYLLSGRVHLVLELPDGDKKLELGAGQGVVVPRGIWHKITLQEPGQLIHITPGPGGDHRPLSH
jgi:mannose-6-phosphate isomerase-like protein (cupin superfamily)